MKNSTFILNVLTTLVAGFLIGQTWQENKSNSAYQILEDSYKRAVLSCEKALKTSDSINKNWSNHVYRMQVIVGVKNPDSVFTYKEKVTHKINLKGLTNGNY